jgi:hypothetical protein
MALKLHHLSSIAMKDRGPASQLLRILKSIFFFTIVPDGGTLWHSQKFLYQIYQI